MGKIRGKGKSSLLLAKAANNKWRKMQWHVQAKWRQWQNESVRPF